MELQTNDNQCAAALAITTQVAKLGNIIERVDEYIHANAPTYLKCQRSRLIDFGVMALIEFEDAQFNWDYLKTVFIERLSVYENGAMAWYIDIDRSTDRVLTVRHDNGTQLQFEIGQLLLIALKRVN